MKDISPYAILFIRHFKVWLQWMRFLTICYPNDCTWNIYRINSRNIWRTNRITTLIKTYLFDSFDEVRTLKSLENTLTVNAALSFFHTAILLSSYLYDKYQLHTNSIESFKRSLSKLIKYTFLSINFCIQDQYPSYKYHKIFMLPCEKDLRQGKECHFMQEES